jgi:TolA-binding protein
MPRHTFFSQLRRIVANGLALIVTILAIAGFGWYVAVEYYKLNEKLTAVHLSSKAHDQALEIDSLKSQLHEQELTIARLRSLEPQLKQKDQMIEQLKDALAKACVEPTRADWNILCDRCLVLYSNIIASVSEIKAFKKTDPQGIHSKEKLSILEQRLITAKQQFFDVLLGAGLIAKRAEGSNTFVSINKFPEWSINWDTGEWVPIAASKPSK